MLSPQSKGSSEGGQECPIYHRKGCTSHAGYLLQMMSEQGPENHQGSQPPQTVLPTLVWQMGQAIQSSNNRLPKSFNLQAIRLLNWHFLKILVALFAFVIFIYTFIFLLLACLIECAISLSLFSSFLFNIEQTWQTKHFYVRYTSVCCKYDK